MKSKTFFLDHTVEADAFKKFDAFLQNPVFEVKFAVRLAEKTILILYEEESDHSRNLKTIREHNELTRHIVLAKQIANDKVHGGLVAFRKLKNATQRNVWMLEFFNINSADAEVVTEILNPTIWAAMNKTVNLEDEQ